jgi:hypothetical protein
MHTTRRFEEKVTRRFRPACRLEPLAERHNVDAKAFRKRREAVFRELLGDGQGHQERRGKSIRRQLCDPFALGGEVVDAS